jgi:hypothetical protein
MSLKHISSRACKCRSHWKLIGCSLIFGYRKQTEIEMYALFIINKSVLDMLAVFVYFSKTFLNPPKIVYFMKPVSSYLCHQFLPIFMYVMQRIMYTNSWTRIWPNIISDHNIGSIVLWRWTALKFFDCVDNNRVVTRMAIVYVLLSAVSQNSLCVIFIENRLPRLHFGDFLHRDNVMITDVCDFSW